MTTINRTINCWFFCFQFYPRFSKKNWLNAQLVHQCRWLVSKNSKPKLCRFVSLQVILQFILWSNIVCKDIRLLMFDVCLLLVWGISCYGARAAIANFNSIINIKDSVILEQVEMAACAPCWVWHLTTKYKKLFTFCIWLELWAKQTHMPLKHEWTCYFNTLSSVL